MALQAAFFGVLLLLPPTLCDATARPSGLSIARLQPAPALERRHAQIEELTLLSRRGLRDKWGKLTKSPSAPPQKPRKSQLARAETAQSAPADERAEQRKTDELLKEADKTTKEAAKLTKDANRLSDLFASHHLSTQLTEHDLMEELGIAGKKSGTSSPRSDQTEPSFHHDSKHITDQEVMEQLGLTPKDLEINHSNMRPSVDARKKPPLPQSKVKAKGRSRSD